MLLMMLKQFPPVKRTTQSPDENTFDSLWSCPLSLSIRVFIKSVTSITNPQPPSIHLVIKKLFWLWRESLLFMAFMDERFSVSLVSHIFFAQFLSGYDRCIFCSFLKSDSFCKHWKPNKNHLMNKLTKTIYQNEVGHECNFLYCCHYCCWVTACVRVVMLIVLHLTHLCCKYWYIVRNSAYAFLIHK